MQTRNDLTAAVPKFCLSLETHRRTSEGRVRTSQEFLTHFFPHDGASSSDRLFRYMPNDVRGPILAAWGIRGAKASLRDDDAKVQSVVHDALVAGDIDHGAFEDGLSADTVVRWAPLGDWWTFWRGGKLSKVAIQKGLAVAYDLLLFDAKWFFDTIEGRGGKLRGTDVIADGLSKDDLTEWMRNVHQSGDGSPKGLLAAIGWDKIVAKTANEVLIAVVDAMVTKVGLTKQEKGSDKTPEKSPGGGHSPAAGSGATSGASASGAASTTSATSGAPGASAAAGASSNATTGEKASAAPATPTDAVSVGNRPTKPPDDNEWPDEPGKTSLTPGALGNASTTAVPGAPAAPTLTGSSVESETTVSTKGELVAAPASEDSNAGDDGMIVVVDDEGVDVATGDLGSTSTRGDHDPPTAPRLEAAPVVEKGGKRSERPPPAPPPPRPSRASR